MNKILLANFKSNKSIKETSVWFEHFLKNVGDEIIGQNEVSIAPSFVALDTSQKLIENSQKNLTLAVQDISQFPAGKYTGAISTKNIEGLKIKYAILGHSERRKYFGETSHDVFLKVEQCLDEGIIPIICLDTEYLDEQLRMIDSDKLKKCVVAYEPLSAVGTGNNQDVGEVSRVVERVKVFSDETRVIYGGSVSDQNVGEYLLVSDGVLVGGASLDPQQFLKLVIAANVS